MSEAARIAEIVRGLSEAQRKYLRAVAASAEPYEPRHGRTANWALSHGYADTIVRLKDGREGLWRSFGIDDRMTTGVETIGGQRLTQTGLAIVAHLLATDRKDER